MVSDDIFIEIKKHNINVLILVLMEYGLWQLILQKPKNQTFKYAF